MRDAFVPEGAGASRASIRQAGVQSLLLCIPAPMLPSLTPLLRSLLSQLDSKAETFIVTHRACAGAVRSLLAVVDSEGGVIELPDNAILDMWTRDNLRVAVIAGTRSLVVRKSLGVHMRAALEQVARLADMPLVLADAMTDGGNIVEGEDYVLAGGSADAGLCDPHKCVVNIASRFDVPAETTRDIELAGAPWREIHHSGNAAGTRQPLFHIDLFLTPAGRDGEGTHRLLVGDPGLAARILGHAPMPHALQDHFDNIAVQLAAQGFAVIRNPLPLVYCDRMAERERQWYFASANNALVREFPRGRYTVWMPLYGHGNWPQLVNTDAANADIWRELGYDVRAVEACQPLAENRGGLRCLAVELGARTGAVELT